MVQERNRFLFTSPLLLSRDQADQARTFVKNQNEIFALFILQINNIDFHKNIMVNALKGFLTAAGAVHIIFFLRLVIYHKLKLILRKVLTHKCFLHEAVSHASTG